MNGRNGLRFDILMYPDHLWNWFHFCHVLLVFLILAEFWFCKTSQICCFWAFLRTRSELKFVMLMCPDHLQNWLDFGHGLLIFLIFHDCWFVPCQSDWPLGQKKAATAIKSLDLLVHLLHLVISEEIKTANSGVWKIFSYRVGVSLTIVQSDFLVGSHLSIAFGRQYSFYTNALEGKICVSWVLPWHGLYFPNIRARPWSSHIICHSLICILPFLHY